MNVTKEECKNALRVLIDYCNQYDDGVCHKYMDFTPPHECIFWDTCHYDYEMVCISLKTALEDLEREEKMNHG